MSVPGSALSDSLVEVLQGAHGREDGFASLTGKLEAQYLFLDHRGVLDDPAGFWATEACRPLLEAWDHPRLGFRAVQRLLLLYPKCVLPLLKQLGEETAPRMRLTQLTRWLEAQEAILPGSFGEGILHILVHYKALAAEKVASQSMPSGEATPKGSRSGKGRLPRPEREG